MNRGTMNISLTPAAILFGNDDFCCKSEERTLLQFVPERVNTEVIGHHCLADKTGSARPARAAVGAARSYFMESERTRQCFSEYDSFITKTSELWKISGQCITEIRGKWDQQKAKNIGKKCSVNADCYTSCRNGNCVVPVRGEGRAHLACMFSQLDLPQIIGHFTGNLNLTQAATIDDISESVLAKFSRNECRGPGTYDFFLKYGCNDDSPHCSLTQEICEERKVCNWDSAITKQDECEGSESTKYFCSPNDCIGCGSITQNEGCELNLYFIENTYEEVVACDLNYLDAVNAAFDEDSILDALEDAQNQKSACIEALCTREGGKWVREPYGLGRCFDTSATNADECAQKCNGGDMPEAPKICYRHMKEENDCFLDCGYFGYTEELYSEEAPINCEHGRCGRPDICAVKEWNTEMGNFKAYKEKFYSGKCEAGGVRQGPCTMECSKAFKNCLDGADEPVCLSNFLAGNMQECGDGNCDIFGECGPGVLECCSPYDTECFCSGECKIEVERCERDADVQLFQCKVDAGVDEDEMDGCYRHHHRMLSDCWEHNSLNCLQGCDFHGCAADDNTCCDLCECSSACSVPFKQCSNTAQSMYMSCISECAVDSHSCDEAMLKCQVDRRMAIASCENVLNDMQLDGSCKVGCSPSALECTGDDEAADICCDGCPCEASCREDFFACLSVEGDRSICLERKNDGAFTNCKRGCNVFKACEATGNDDTECCDQCPCSAGCHAEISQCYRDSNVGIMDSDPLCTLKKDHELATSGICQAGCSIERHCSSEMEEAGSCCEGCHCGRDCREAYRQCMAMAALDQAMCFSETTALNELDGVYSKRSACERTFAEAAGNCDRNVLTTWVDDGTCLLGCNVDLCEAEGADYDTCCGCECSQDCQTAFNNCLGGGLSKSACISEVQTTLVSDGTCRFGCNPSKNNANLPSSTSCEDCTASFKTCFENNSLGMCCMEAKTSLMCLSEKPEQCFYEINRLASVRKNLCDNAGPRRKRRLETSDKRKRRLLGKVATEKKSKFSPLPFTLLPRRKLESIIDVDREEICKEVFGDAAVWGEPPKAAKFEKNCLSNTHSWIVGKYDTLEKCERPTCSSDTTVSDKRECESNFECSRSCERCTSNGGVPTTCIQTQATDDTSCKDLSNGNWECDGGNCVCVVELGRCNSPGERVRRCEQFTVANCLTNKLQFLLQCTISHQVCENKAECEAQGVCTDWFIEDKACILDYPKIDEMAFPSFDLCDGALEGRVTDDDFDIADWTVMDIGGIGCSLVPATFENFLKDMKMEFSNTFYWDLDTSVMMPESQVAMSEEEDDNCPENLGSTRMLMEDSLVSSDYKGLLSKLGKAPALIRRILTRQIYRLQEHRAVQIEIENFNWNLKNDVDINVCIKDMANIENCENETLSFSTLCVDKSAFPFAQCAISVDCATVLIEIFSRFCDVLNEAARRRKLSTPTRNSSSTDPAMPDDIIDYLNSTASDNLNSTASDNWNDTAYDNWNDTAYDNWNDTESEYMSGSEYEYMSGSEYEYMNGSESEYMSGSEYEYMNGSESEYMSGSEYEYMNGSESEYMSGSEYEYMNGSESEYMSGSESEYMSGSEYEYMSGSEYEYMSGTGYDYMSGTGYDYEMNSGIEVYNIVPKILDNFGIGLIPNILGSRKFVSELRSRSKSMSQECQESAQNLLGGYTCFMALEGNMTVIQSEFACKIIVNLMPQLKREVEDLLPGQDPESILGVSGIEDMESCKTYFVIDNQGPIYRKLKSSTAISGRKLIQRADKIISDFIVSEIGERLEGNIAIAITTALSSCASAEYSESCVKDTGNHVAQSVFTVLRNLVNALIQKKLKLNNRLNSTGSSTEDGLISSSLNRTHCQMIGGRWHEKAHTKFDCLKSLKACCRKTDLEGHCVNEKFYKEETRDSCLKCGKEAAWTSQLRWENRGRWVSGKLSTAGKWTKKALEKQNEWTTVADVNKAQLLFEDAVEVPKLFKAINYAFCKTSHLNSALKTVSRFCGVNNLGNVDDVDDSELIASASTYGEEKIPVGKGSLTTTSDQNDIDVTSHPETKAIGNGAAIVQASANTTSDGASANTASDGASANTASDGASANTTSGGASANTASDGASGRRRSLEEAVTFDYGASCYTVVTNSKVVLVGQLLGKCIGISGTATTLSGSFRLCLEIDPDIPLADHFSTYDIATKSGDEFRPLGISITHNKPDNLLCGSIASYGIYCPIYRVADYEGATQSADASCESLNMVVLVIYYYHISCS